MGLTDWIQGILRSRRKHASRQASRQQRAALSPGLFVRELEERRVLSVDTLPWDEPLRQLVLDAGSPADDGAADSFHLAAEGDTLQAAMNDQPAEPVHLSTVSAVRVEGADGVDALRIDFSGSGPNGGEFTVAIADNTLQAIVDGNVIGIHSLDGIQILYLTGVVGQNDVVTLDFRSNPDLLTLSTIHVDLEGDASDDLVVISDGQAVRIDYTDVSSGEITVGTTSVVFSGLGENTLTVDGTDDLTLTFPDTAENIVFTNHEDAEYSQVTYHDDGDDFTTKFANPLTSLTVNFGNNGQTATFTSLDAGFNPTAGVTINGGTGNDAITVTSLGTGFAGALAVDGGDGNDSVTFDAVLALASLNVTAETIPVSGASVTTSGGNIDLNGNLTLLGANVLLSTGTGAGNIQIGSITGGDKDLQLISGSGTTTVTGAATGLGTLTIQGDLSPGLDDIDTFDVDGSVTFASDSGFLVNLNGTGSADQLIVHGDDRTLTLGGVSLVVTLADAEELSSGQSFKIVGSTGAAPALVGVFKNADGSANLNHGDKFTVGDTVFRIEYNDGDVILTEANDAPVQTGTAPDVIEVDEDSANDTAVTLGMDSLEYSPGGGTDESGQTLTYRITAIPSFITVWNGATQVNENESDVLTLTELQGLTYKTIPDANGSGDLVWTVTDDGTPNETLTESLAIMVTAVNDAPVATGTAPAAIEVDEDSANDTAVTLGMGDLEYSPGGGTDESGQTLTYRITAIPSFITVWNGATQVNENDALTLTALQGLTYKTIPDANGSGDLVWTVTDDGTPNETLTESLAITVTAVNDAPVATGSATLAAVAEDTTNPPGETVAILFGDNFSDVKDGSLADILYGVAITNNAATGAQGTWEYHNGTTWEAVGNPNAATALVVKADDKLRFIPVAGYVGTPGGLTVTLIETGGGTPNTGDKVNLDPPGARGGTTIYSAASVELSTSVTAVNDPPTLTATPTDPTFTENGSAVTLYSGTSIDVVEAGDSVQTLMLTVSGLQNGADEILVVDGTEVSLTDGAAGTTTDNGIDYSVSVIGGTATVTLSKDGDLTVSEAQALIDGLQYRNASDDPLGADRTVTLTSIQDSGGTDSGGQDTTALNVVSTVTLVAVNDPPTLTATGENPTFTEDGPAVTLYSGTSIDVVEAGDSVQTLMLTVSGLQNGADEILVVDGTEVSLTDGAAGTTTDNGIDYSVSVIGGTATVTLSKDGDLTVSEAQVLIDGLQYRNASDDPLGADRTVTLTSIQDSGGTDSGGQDTTALNVVSTVTLVAVNDPPTLTATGENPAFTEDGLAVALFSGTVIDVVEAADRVKTLELTVSGLENGVDEILVVDGSEVSLTDGASGTTDNGIDYSVSVTGGTATVTLSKDGDLTVSEAQALIDGLQYRNASDAPVGAERTVTLTSIQDDGGTDDGGQDTTALNVVSTVTLVAVNDPPTLTATGENPTFTEDGPAVTLYSGTSIDVVEAADRVKTLELTVSGLENGVDEILVVDGSEVSLTDGASGTTDNGIDYSVSVIGGTATVTLSKDGDLTVSEAQALIDGLQYRNASDDPLGADRTVTLTSIQDSGGTDSGGQDTTALNVVSTVTLVAVNDPPTLTATGENPTFTEEGPAVTLYSGTSIDVVEAGDSVQTLMLTVSGLQNGADEILVVDGTEVSLTDGAAGTTTDNGIDYSVSVIGGTATVTLSKDGDLTVSEAQALIDGLQYRNASDDPLGADRTVTLTSIQDSGGTDSGGQDTTVLAIASTVTVVAVNDPPTLAAMATDPTFTEDGPAVTLYEDTSIDVVEAADRVKTLVLTVSGLQNGGDEILVVDGTEVALTDGAAGRRPTMASITVWPCPAGQRP
jgi:flagellar basal body rod protein FlgG